MLKSLRVSILRGWAPDVLYDQRTTFVARYSLPDALVGLSEDSEIDEQWEIYPNPTARHLYIRGESNKWFDRVEVYDMAGRSLVVDELASPQSTHFLSLDLPSGSYRLILLRDESVEYSTILVKE